MCVRESTLLPQTNGPSYGEGVAWTVGLGGGSGIAPAPNNGDVTVTSDPKRNVYLFTHKIGETRMINITIGPKANITSL